MHMHRKTKMRYVDVAKSTNLQVHIHVKVTTHGYVIGASQLCDEYFTAI